MTNSKKTVEDLIVYGKSKSSSTHAKMLLASLLNRNPLELLNILDMEVTPDIIEKYVLKLKELQENQPIQYVIGKSCFYGNDFLVNKDTLIPRFETEELVEKTLFYIEKLFSKKELSIIDLGTGTGCIGITLKKHLPHVKVTLVDIDSNTLQVTRENAKNLNTEVEIIESDFFTNINQKFDVVISNPPYIKDNEEIEEIVKNNEPSIALYAGEDGLDCYKKILSTISNYLNEKYLIAFEIGSTQKKDIVNLIKLYLPNSKIDCYQDLQERDRMIFIYN